LVFKTWTDASQDSRVIANLKRNFDSILAHRFHSGRTYRNYVSRQDIEEELLGAAGEHAQRIRAVKEKWDPKNLFRSLPPSSGPQRSRL